MAVNLTWSSVGAGGLVVLFVLLYYTGRVLARSTHDRIVSLIKEGYEGRIHDKDQQIRLLTQANERLTRTNDALLAQHRQSLEIGRTAGSVIESLSSVTIATAGGVSSGPDVA